MSVPELRRFVHRQNRRVLHLFPDTARIDNGSLSIDGIAAADLVREHGSPLVVYDEATLRARARAYREAAPTAAVVYGTKAFPNVALMRILAEEGIGADVSTLGELRFAQAAGITGADLVVHGNNKSQAELEAAAEAGALVVVDSLEEIERAREARVSRTLVRVTPGIEADTHEAIRTGHHGSKFGLTPDDSLEALRRDPETEGLHMHIGSQLRDADRGTRGCRLDRGVRGASPHRARLDDADARPGRRPGRRRDPRRAGGTDRRVRRHPASQRSSGPASRRASRCRA